MAMQTGISSSKVLILMGAGLTGSVILRSGRLSDVMSELQELIKGINEVEISSHYDPALLAAQVRRLAQEVRELALSRPVTILNGDASSGGNLASYVLPAAAVGAMGYCYMWWKGWSFSDVMFVTKRNMANAVATVSKQLEQVSATLASTRRHLSQRLEILDGKVDEQVESSKAILNKVNEVRSDLSQIGFDIEAIQSMVTGLEGKVGLIESKQDYMNAGIYYLCQAAGGIKDGQNAKQIQDVSSKLLLSLDQSSTTFSNISVKGLQFLTDSTELAETGNMKKNTVLQQDLYGTSAKNVVTKTTILHKSYPRGISQCREGNVR